MRLALSVMFLVATAAFAQDSLPPRDADDNMIENELLRIRYGPDKSPEGNILTGITEFIYKPAGINFADSMDAYGCGYAKYHSGGPDAFEITHEGDDFIEATLTMKNGVDVLKKDRLYAGRAIFEIEYEKLEIGWWEDFYRVPGDDLVYSVYGIDREIDAAEHAKLRAAAEEKAGHNFGDAFLEAAGVSTDEVGYRGYFIFGVYARESGVGLGFVMPKAVGLHDGWKLWSMHNYESFPFHGTEAQLPLKRWIFVVTGARADLFETGKAIANAAAEGESLAGPASAPPAADAPAT